MPYDEPDATDPLHLVGVELPADEDAHRIAASVFAEEFARMGFDEARIMFLFESPFYAGAHRAYRTLGHETVRALVREQSEFWGHVRFRDEQPRGQDQVSRPAATRDSEPMDDVQADRRHSHGERS